MQENVSRYIVIGLFCLPSSFQFEKCWCFYSRFQGKAHSAKQKGMLFFWGLYRVSHLARGFTGKAEIGRVTFCLIRIIVIPLVVHYYTFREYREEQPSKAIHYSTHSVARLLTHGCLKLFGLENITHQRHLNKKERKKRHHFSTVKPRFKKKIR